MFKKTNLRACLVVPIILMTTSGYLHAQCSATSYSNATDFSNDNSVGNIAYVNSSGILSSDDTYASANATVSLFSANTHYLKATGFNLTVPASATICGIQFRVERSATNIGLFTSVEDNAVRLVKNNTVTGNNLASGTNWTGSDQTIQYGSSSNLWGSTWTPAEINSPDFGIAFSATINGLISLLPSVRIDHIQVRVFYQVLLPVIFSNLQAKIINGYPVISCKLENNENLQSIQLERSTDQKDWKIIHERKDMATKSGAIEFIDSTAGSGTWYFRIKITNNNGHHSISSLKKLVVLSQQEQFHVSNPFNNSIIIYSAENIKELELHTIHGDRLFAKQYANPAKTLTIPGADLPRGTYVLQVNNTRRLIIKN